MILEESNMLQKEKQALREKVNGPKQVLHSLLTRFSTTLDCQAKPLHSSQDDFAIPLPYTYSALLHLCCHIVNN